MSVSDRPKPDAGPKPKKSTFKCPDCGCACPVTSTKNITPTVKEFFTSCSNDGCGGRYVFASEPVRILVPSLTPNPKVNLPHSRVVPRGPDTPPP